MRVRKRRFSPDMEVREILSVNRASGAGKGILSWFVAGWVTVAGLCDLTAAESSAADPAAGLAQLAATGDLATLRIENERLKEQIVRLRDENQQLRRLIAARAKWVRLARSSAAGLGSQRIGLVVSVMIRFGSVILICGTALVGSGGASACSLRSSTASIRPEIAPASP